MQEVFQSKDVLVRRVRLVALVDGLVVLLELEAVIVKVVFTGLAGMPVLTWVLN